MHKLRCFIYRLRCSHLPRSLAWSARSAELEGALQYPPRSVGQDAQTATAG
jgi:hypothetical protein